MFANIVLLVIVVIFIAVVVDVHLNREIKTNELESHLLTTRLIYSPNCFLYQNEIRKYPGIIDLDKFDKNIIERCLINKENTGFIIDLKEINGTSIKTININEDISDFLKFCNVKRKRFDCYFDEKYILLEENNEIKPALLNISLAIKNE